MKSNGHFWDLRSTPKKFTSDTMINSFLFEQIEQDWTMLPIITITQNCTKKYGTDLHKSQKIW